MILVCGKCGSSQVRVIESSTQVFLSCRRCGCLTEISDGVGGVS